MEIKIEMPVAADTIPEAPQVVNFMRECVSLSIWEISMRQSRYFTQLLKKQEMRSGTISMLVYLSKRDIMQMLKDFLIWLVVWTQAITNISMREICSAEEVSRTVLIERISQTVVATLIVVPRLFVWIAAVNVWVATLSLAVKVKLCQKGSHLLIKELW